MCGRYVTKDQAAIERAFAIVKPWWRFDASYNVAPSQQVPVGVASVHFLVADGAVLEARYVQVVERGRSDPARRVRRFGSGQIRVAFKAHLLYLISRQHSRIH